jgi:hypothetical protein
MDLGINPTVDDTSTDYLNKLRNDLGIHLLELAADADPKLVGTLIDGFMKLAAPRMHDACSDAFHAGEAAATDTVPDASILEDFDASNPVLDAVEADLIGNGADTAAQAVALLPELESRLGELTDRERVAVLERFAA